MVRSNRAEADSGTPPGVGGHRRSIIPLFANQGSLARMVSAGSDGEGDATMRSESNPGQGGNTGSASGVAIHTSNSCVSRCYSLLERLGLFQNFADRAVEEKFCREYWKESHIPFVAAVGSGLFWGAARTGLGMYAQSIGWSKFRECCDGYYRFYDGSEDEQLKMILYETAYPGFWFILLAGRRIDATPLTFLLGLVPEHVRKRYSKGKNIFHMWNNDGSVRISAVGDCYGSFGSLGVAVIAASPYLGWASTRDFGHGASHQLPWVLVTFMIMLRLLTHHGLFLFFASMLFACVGFTIRAAIEAVGGGSTLFVYEIVFLFISSFIGTIAVACVRQHESSTRSSFLRLQAEDSVQKVLYTVLHKILPDRAIDQIADCARANAPLVASAESFLDTAVIFIRVNLEEAASRTAKQKMRELNRVYSKFDKIVELHEGVYTVETVGPEYLCCVGAPESSKSPSCVAIAFAIELERGVAALKWDSGAQVELKIGIHSGQLTAGISGTVSPQYRLFGDTVNTASRMKSQAAPGEIILSDTTVEKVKMCCGVEAGEDGRIRCIDPAAVLTIVGVRSVKGLGSMRLWRAEAGRGDNMQINPGACLTCRATGRERISRFSDFSNSSMENSGAMSFKPFAEWMTFTRGLEGRDQIEDMQNFDSLLDFLPQNSSLDMQPSLMFRFRNTSIEAAYNIWFNRTMVKSRKFLIFFSVLYAVFSVPVAHSLAKFSLEPIASSTEWMAFTVVSIVFLCTIPLALAVAAYLLIYASVNTKERYAWVQSWIFAYTVLAYVLWLFCPRIHFPTVLLKEAQDRDASGTMPYPNNFFEVVIFSSGRRSAGLAFESLPQVFKDTHSSIGNTDFSTYFLYALTQLTFHARIDLTCFFVAIFVAASVTAAILGGQIDSEAMICLLLVFLESVYLAFAKRREFRSIILASRQRAFVGRIVQNLLPDHIFQALVKGNLESVADEFVCGHFFLDLKGFTQLSSSLTPEESFMFISSLFSSFDAICEKWGVTKIETIGDAYWCASGLPGTIQSDDKVSMIRLMGMAVEIQTILRERSLPCFSVPAIKAQDCRIQARVAIHYGKCTGGVVGSSRPRYHLFGSAIEIVQVLEEEGSVDGVVLSRTAARVMGLNKNGVCDDGHLLSVLKNVDSRFLSGCCLVMENYRVSDHGATSIQHALDTEAAGSSSNFERSDGDRREQHDVKSCWEEGVGSNVALPAFLITMRQTGLPAPDGVNGGRIVL